MAEPKAHVLVDEGSLQGVTIPSKTAQAVTGLSDEAFYRALKRQEIPAVRIGRKYLVLGAPFREMLGLQPKAEATAA